MVELALLGSVFRSEANFPPGGRLRKVRDLWSRMNFGRRILRRV